MNTTHGQKQGYAIAFFLGAAGGGLFVTLATRAIPKMMSQMMAGMMQNTMSNMGEGGRDPSEM